MVLSPWSVVIAYSCMISGGNLALTSSALLQPITVFVNDSISAWLPSILLQLFFLQSVLAVKTLQTTLSGYAEN